MPGWLSGCLCSCAKWLPVAAWVKWLPVLHGCLCSCVKWLPVVAWVKWLPVVAWVVKWRPVLLCYVVACRCLGG